MFDSRKNNSGCQFKEEIVSYIYNEFSPSQKKEFEGHLQNCSSCEEEIAGFGIVRKSLLEWKEIELDSRSIPPVQIDFNKKVENVVSTDRAEIGFFEKLNGLFSPLFVKTATGFAAILIMLGLGWVVFNSLSPASEQIANREEKITPVKSTQENNLPDYTPKKQDIVTNSEEINQSEKPVSAPIPAKKETASINTKKKRKPVSPKPTPKRSKKVYVAKKRNIKPINKSIKKNNLIKPQEQNASVIDKAPSLTDFNIDDNADEDIRLADIFDEVGSDD